MEDIGIVTAILNDRLLLVRTEKQINPNTELTVFGRISPESLQAAAGLTQLDYPKGLIRVISRQNETIYLAERFRQAGEQRRRIIPSPFNPNLLSEILKGQEEVVEIPGPWSAEFDLKSSLNIKVDRQIKTGDLIALI